MRNFTGNNTLFERTNDLLQKKTQGKEIVQANVTAVLSIYRIIIHETV